MDEKPEIVLRSSDRKQNAWASVLIVAGSIASREPGFLWLALSFVLVLVLFTNKRVELYADKLVIYRWALFRLGKSVHGYSDLKGVMYRPGGHTTPASIDLHWQSGKRTKGIEQPGDYIRSRFEEVLHTHRVPSKKR